MTELITKLHMQDNMTDTGI